MIEGQKLQLGGREFIAPPAPFMCMRKYADMFNGKAEATAEIMADIILITLQRNYPELTQDELDMLLDVENMRAAFKVVMRVSGMKDAAPGEPQSL